MRVAVVGTGYVGLTTAVALAYLGHEVYGVEHDRDKLALIERGKCPIFEPGLEELMSLSAQRLTFTHNVKEALRNTEVAFLAVGTPAMASGAVDLSYIENASQEIADALQDGRNYTLVIKSTVPVGTDQIIAGIVKKRLKERGVEVRFSLVVNPEFLREGFAVHDTLYPDRVVAGAEDRMAINVIREVYRSLIDQTFEPPTFLPRPAGLAKPSVVETDPSSAIMIKYASNAFLATKISFANEIAGLCERVGANVLDVTRGMGLDSRIGPRFLAAGVGWGGSCFPKDTLGLLATGQEQDYAMPVLRAACAINERQRHVVVEKLQSALGSLRGRTVGLLGIAFKPNTDDIREAPALEIARQLLGLGAFVRMHDPVVPAKRVQALMPGVEYVSDLYRVPQGCDGLVLVTEWEVYRHLDLAVLGTSMRTRVLVDGRNLFSPVKAKGAGFSYFGIGQ